MPNFYKCGTNSKLLKKNCNPTDRQDIPNLSRPRQIACPKCKKTFHRIYNLNRHLENVHLNPNVKINNSCVFCEQQFGDKFQLQRHIISHIGEKHYWCDKCGKEFSSKAVVKVHQKQHNIYKRYICNLCPRSFTSSSGLQCHKIRHRAKLFPCVMCWKYFACNRDLQQHIVCHLKEKPFICPICGEEYRGHRVLMRHLEMIHNQKKKSTTKPDTANQKPQCVFCFQQFNTNTELEKHIKTHLKERPVSCSVCNEEFKYESGLKRHLKRNKCEKMKITYVKTATGEWELRCGVCSKSFKKRFALLLHQETHKVSRRKPYACAVCKRNFFKIQSLLEHLEVIHKGVKNHECIFCEMKFGRFSHLNGHIIAHTREKHYWCSICGMELARLVSLNKHKKLHTK